MGNSDVFQGGEAESVIYVVRVSVEVVWRPRMVGERDRTVHDGTGLGAVSRSEHY